MINRFRRFLILIGKVLPFIICGLVCFNYLETLFSMATRHFIEWNGVVIPSTPISFFVGRYFEYNLQMLVVLVVISIAIQTCVFNKLACLYMGVNLLEKSYFDFELEPTTIYIICIANIVIAGLLTYKGIKIIVSK